MVNVKRYQPVDSGWRRPADCVDNDYETSVGSVLMTTRFPGETASIADRLSTTKWPRDDQPAMSSPVCSVMIFDQWPIHPTGTCLMSARCYGRAAFTNGLFIAQPVRRYDTHVHRDNGRATMTTQSSKSTCAERLTNLTLNLVLIPIFLLNSTQ